MPALIIGATGQVGAAILRQLGPGAIPVPRTELDLTTMTPATAADYFAATQPDAIYCVAGATDVERCEFDSEWAFSTNSRGPEILAAAARGIPFIFFSTDYVFDGGSGPYGETAETNPLSAYGRSKLEGEQAVLAAHPHALVVRTTGVFGPDAQQKNFLYTLRRVLQSGGTMRVPADQISNPTYNEDLAAAAIALVKKQAAGIFHAGGSELLSRIDFAHRAAAILGLDTTNLVGVSTAELKQQAARPLRSGLRNAKLLATLGRDPMRPLDEAIRNWAAA